MATAKRPQQTWCGMYSTKDSHALTGTHAQKGKTVLWAQSFDTDEWPKYASNSLDSKPYGSSPSEICRDHDESALRGLFKRKRCERPRALVVLVEDKWVITTDAPVDTQYIFISWHWGSFYYDGSNGDHGMLHSVIKAAEYITRQSGIGAYWLDAQCVGVAPLSDLHSVSGDVYGMSDIVRCAQSVAVLLPDDGAEHKRAWIQRLWTLPEGLLARGKLQIWICNPSIMKKADVTRTRFITESLQCTATSPHNLAVRILAAHYDGLLNLSRLERIMTTIVALSGQSSSKYSEADMAYAFMGLTAHRIEPNITDTEFQAMVRILSLISDNDQIIERIIASLPSPKDNTQQLFRGLLEPDQFGTYLWDIQPQVAVVGVGHNDGIVFLSGSKILPLTPAGLPTAHNVDYTQSNRGLLIAAVTSVLVWLISSIWHGVSYRSFAKICIAVASLFVMEVIVRRHSKTNSGRYRHGLIVLDGPVSKAQLEMGLDLELSYEPSSTPFSIGNRNLSRRKGTEPIWVTEPHRSSWTKGLAEARSNDKEPVQVEDQSWTIRPLEKPLKLPELYKGHEMFTLVDMDRHTVSIFQARRRPTVALLCGSEGGMSRTVACSWDVDKRLLTKETVLRLPYTIWDEARSSGWVKLSMI